MRRWPVLLLVVILLGGILLWEYQNRKNPQREQPLLSIIDILGDVPAEGFKRAIEPRTFFFPKDHGPHPGFRNEWWYFTGNLNATNGRRFGYQLTFFRTALAPRPVERASHWGANDVYMVHFAVTDEAGNRIHAAERFSRAALNLAGAGGNPLKIHLEDWMALESGSNPFAMKLSADNVTYALDLRLTALTQPVLNGEGGLSRKSGSVGNASYYYSVPRMATEGTVRIGGETFAVTGLSWFDREWSTSALEKDQGGWDWFSLQLSDGRSLMFYRLRRKDGSIDPFSNGTFIAADGASRTLTMDEVNLQVIGWWRSPQSGTSYPARWRLQIPRERLDLEIVPIIPDQELLLSVHYWEGAVTARGQETSLPGGSGYVELTGY